MGKGNEAEPSSFAGVQSEIPQYAAGYREDCAKLEQRERQVDAVLKWMAENFRGYQVEMESQQLPAKTGQQGRLVWFEMGDRNGPRWCRVQVERVSGGRLQVSGQRTEMDSDEVLEFTGRPRLATDFGIPHWHGEFLEFLEWFSGKRGPAVFPRR